jgi:hypothetical protein
VLRSRSLLALVTLTLASSLAACSGAAPVVVRHPAATVDVWLIPTAASVQVLSVRTKLKHTPEVASCAYLDHAASYRKMKGLIAKHILPSYYVSIITPGLAPTFFACKVWTKSDVGLVEKRFGKVTGVMGVYPESASR